MSENLINNNALESLGSPDVGELGLAQNADALQAEPSLNEQSFGGETVARTKASKKTDVKSGDKWEASAHKTQVAIDQVASTDGLVKEQSAVDSEVQSPMSEFEALGLAPELNRAIFDLGYSKPTTVQTRTIPLAMQDISQGQYNDLMVSSQTGSGKTAAFLLPVLDTLLAQQKQEEQQEDKEWNAKVAEALAKGEPQPRRPKRKNPLDARHFKPAVPGALVLCPTRELAQQVAQDAIGLVKHCKGLRIATVVGGMPYAMQISKLQNANLVVATPGRLIDLQNSKQIQLSKVQFLVIDEADRMLDLGFADDLAQINELTKDRRQTMMFSATFALRIQQLAARIMRSPKRVQVDSPQDRHNNILQILFWADSPVHKRKLLDHWLRDTSIAQAIVFASTQIECDSLAQDLQQSGFSSVALHGALTQSIRNRRLNALREGKVQILVATDVAARGIDVPSISHVFNYGLPMKAEDYVHRIGRTGRAGRTGSAVTFAEFRDRRKILDIEHFTQQTLKAEIIPGLEPQPRSGKATSAPQAKRGGRFDGFDARGHKSARGSKDSRGPRDGRKSHEESRDFGGGGFGANTGAKNYSNNSGNLGANNSKSRPGATSNRANSRFDGASEPSRSGSPIKASSDSARGGPRFAHKPKSAR
jgi:superfamily II DNA/RNA helicase